MPLEFRVRIEPRLPVVIDNTLTFEPGATRQQAADPELFVYEHHGEGFGQADPGALTAFFEDLVMGRPMPLTFATPALKDVDTLFAIALFLHRDLAIAPSMPGIVAQVDLVHRRGLPLLGHLGEDFARFLRLLRAYFPEGLSKTDMGQRLTTSLDWIREYVLEGRFPALGKPFAEAREIQRGSNGFIIAETSGDLLEGWMTLFARGHLRGLLVTPERKERRRVLAAKKSHYCAFDLGLAARLLNEMEAAMGEPTTWKADGNWLWGPTAGTLLEVPHLVEVFIRV